MFSILFLSLLLTANAVIIPTVYPRALPPGCEEVYEEIALVEFNDGPTSSGDAGIGAEFETIAIQFTNNQCSLTDTFAAKRKTVRGRSGTNYVLSVDTSVEQGMGTLSAEYVLDGRNIKVGDGSAGAAGKAAHDDLMNWETWNDDPPNQIFIDNYPQCSDPWIVRGLTESTDKEQIFWAPQVTAAMPLEALYSLMVENVQGITDNRNILDGETESTSRGQNIQLVTKDYFQSLSLRIDLDQINDAVLGFCSLVLSYAKAANKPADPNDPNVQERSPKSYLPFMPRTEFVTIYNAVKSVFAAEDDLSEIFNILACYKTDSNLQVSIDSDYCSGDPANPVPDDTFGGLEYNYIGNFPNPDSFGTLSIKQWIQDIGTGSSNPDLLTTFDKNYDSSIGGLGVSVERMYKLTRTAPLFEFRDLDPLYTSEFEGFMGQVDSSIQDLHQRFASRPMMRRKVKRQGDVSSCVLPTTTPTTNTTTPSRITARACICGSTTLPLLTLSSATVVDQSCSYTALPTSATNPITIETEYWTSNCQACTLVGGIADSATCTSVSGCTPTTAVAPTPTFAVFLSNNSPIGDENDENGGADLRSEVYDKLKALCPDDGNTCDSTTDAEIDNIPTIVGGGDAYETLTLTIQDSHYDSTDDRDRMLAAAVSSWQQAVSRSCKEVEYQSDADPTGSGCGEGPVERDLMSRNLAALDERTPLSGDGGDLGDLVCNYMATICSGPDHITTVLAGDGNAYENHMDIQLGWKLNGDSAFNEFICEFVIDGLTALALAVAPELAGPELFEDLEFQAICEELAGGE